MRFGFELRDLRRAVLLLGLGILTVGLVAACDGQEDSPVQADQDLVDDLDPAATPPTSDDDLLTSTVGTGITGDQGNDSPAVNGDDNVAGDQVPEDDDELETDVGVRVEPTIVDAVLGDDVTVVGVLATFLSEQVITLEGVTLEEQPAEELLVIIPEELTPDYEALDEGSLVAVAGEIVQVTDERLAAVDRSVFDEHGEFLEGFRASWGILATDVSVAEEGEE